jgi:hypothetical protein
VAVCYPFAHPTPYAYDCMYKVPSFPQMSNLCSSVAHHLRQLHQFRVSTTCINCVRELREKTIVRRHLIQLLFGLVSINSEPEHMRIIASYTELELFAGNKLIRCVYQLRV